MSCRNPVTPQQPVSVQLASSRELWPGRSGLHKVSVLLTTVIKHCSDLPGIKHRCSHQQTQVTHGFRHHLSSSLILIVPAMFSQQGSQPGPQTGFVTTRFTGLKFCHACKVKKKLKEGPLTVHIQQLWYKYRVSYPAIASNNLYLKSRQPNHASFCTL